MKNLLLSDYLVTKVFKKLNLKRSCRFFFYKKTRLPNMLTHLCEDKWLSVVGYFTDCSKNRTCHKGESDKFKQ